MTVVTQTARDQGCDTYHAGLTRESIDATFTANSLLAPASMVPFV